VQRHKSMVLIALVIGALLLSLAIPVLGSGATAEVASAGSTEQSLGLPLKSLGDLDVSNLQSLLPQGLSDDPPVDKWAVVIGISDYATYEGKEYDLLNPHEDAREMVEALVCYYGFPLDHIIYLCNDTATAANILYAIYWLEQQEGPNSTVVFFFSGHGGQVADNVTKEYGLDNDNETDGMDEGIVTYDWYGLPDGLLGEMFSAFETTKFALIFDCCYSGGMLDDVDGLKADGRVIVTACKVDQYAWDYEGLGNTLFGYYFVDEAILQGMAQKSARADGVSMEEAFRYAHPRVTRILQPDPDYKHSQPQIYDGFAGELIP
jgi:hypothetical protein